MKKYIISVFLLLTMAIYPLQAKQINYKATFGIFGKVGTIHNTIQKDKTHYTIRTTVKLAGLAKMIMGNPTEEYQSKGHLSGGLMVSDYYVMTSLKKHKKVTKEYFIDHKRHRVMKRYRKWIDGKLVSDTKKDLGFYAKDDLLTLYFNMDKHVMMHQKEKSFLLKAVGLEKQKGIVKITLPTSKTLKKYQKDLGKSAKWYAKALIVQKNFRKKKGDILLAGGNDGYIKKAVIKDVLLYGDAKLIRTK